MARPESSIGGEEEVRILPMGLKDLPGVLAIEEVSFPTPWSARTFTAELTQNLCACYIVARAGDEVVGYAGMWVLLDEAHVTNIAVHPGWRGKGIGERLMRELMRRALQRGARRATLEVRKSNAVARRLYERLGFEVRGVRKGYYTDTREDAILMWHEDIERLGEREWTE